jgi:hypothetical protein
MSAPKSLPSLTLNDTKYHLPREFTQESYRAMLTVGKDSLSNPVKPTCQTMDWMI